METPTYSIAECTSNRLRAALNAQIRGKSSPYDLDNVSAIWHVESCKGVALPKCRAGVFYPQGKTQAGYKIIVFVTNPKFNNWAEDEGLTIISKWVNTRHIPYDEVNGNNKVDLGINKRTYEEVYDELWLLVDDLAKVDTIALKLGIGLSRALGFRNKMRLEQSAVKHAKQLEQKRIKIGS